MPDGTRAESLTAGSGMPKRSGRLASAVYRYRTEHNTPIRQALSIGLGLYIGASPFMGLHLRWHSGSAGCSG